MVFELLHYKVLPDILYFTFTSLTKSVKHGDYKWIWRLDHSAVIACYFGQICLFIYLFLPMDIVNVLNLVL